VCFKVSVSNSTLEPHKASTTNPNQMASQNQFVFNRLKLINALEFLFQLTHSSVLKFSYSLRFETFLLLLLLLFVLLHAFVSFVNLFYIFKYFSFLCIVCILFCPTSQFQCALLLLFFFILLYIFLLLLVLLLLLLLLWSLVISSH